MEVSFALLTFIAQTTNGSRSEYGHVPGSSGDGSGPPRRQRPSQSGDAETEAAMLGARVQWAAVFDIQQSSPPPTREIGTGDEIIMPQLRGGVYEDDGPKRAPCPRQVQAEEGREVEGVGLVVGGLEESTFGQQGKRHLDMRGDAESKWHAWRQGCFSTPGGLGLLDCNALWGGQERHVSHGEDAAPFFSTNRGDIHINGENLGFWECFFLGGFTSTTTGWDGDGAGVGVGWRPAAKERRVELETCASPLVFVARTLLSIMDGRKRGRVLMLCRYLALIVTNSLYGYPGVPVPLDIHLAYCIGRFT